MKIIAVYAITQLSTGIQYIGSSANLSLRWKRHRSDLNCKRHHAPWLQRAWTKCGPADFSFTILEELPSVGELRNREIYWLGQCKQTFNNQRPASEAGVLCHGDQSKAQMSKSQKRRFALDPARPISADQKVKISAALKGRVMSESWRKKLSDAAKKRPPVSEATREKLRQANYRRVYQPLSDEQKAKLRAAHLGRRQS